MLEEKIRRDLTEALKEKDILRISTLRFLLAEIHNRQLQKQAELKDEDILAVIRHQVRLRQEAIEAYQKGKRDDLVEKERREMEILNKYLPQQITPDQLEKIIKQTIAKIGAAGPQDFGKVMGAVMEK